MRPGLHPPARFTLTHSDTHLWRRYGRAHRQVLKALANVKIDLSDYAEDTIAHGRQSWALMAFNEYRAAATMSQVCHAMTLAQAPLDLTHAVCQFPGQELHHAHLCALLASILGAELEAFAAYELPQSYLPQAVQRPTQYANALVVANLCVAETISFALLKAALAQARGGFAAPVLKVLCRDEALHAEVGWAYLDWAVEFFSEQDRHKLACTAKAAVNSYRAVWQSTLSKGLPVAKDERCSLSLISAAGQVEAGEHAIAHDVRLPLADYGIVI